MKHSVCALDCPDCCSLLVSPDKLKGNPEHPVTRGFLCGKVARYLEREYSPDRLLYPQKRVDGRFVRVSWDEALDTIAERLTRIAAEFGPESILPYSYAGTMGLLNGAGMDRRFFHRLGASRLYRSICAEAGVHGLIAALGARLGMEPQTFRHSRLIIAWGANILGTNVHLWPFIVEARRNGAKFYVIDPVRNRTGQTADKFFGIYPGSDHALALGLMHVIIKEGLCAPGVQAVAPDYPPEKVEALTGIPKEDVVALAREYATISPAAIRVNYGVQRSQRGAAAVQAIATLPGLIGAWNHIGGGLLLTTSGGFEFNQDARERPDLQPSGPARLVNMSELGKALTELADPPVKALVVYNSNPAAIAPNQSLVLQGLRRPDLFKVVLEQFQTDTADFADIVLPVTTFLEHTDLYYAYGHYYVQLARPALPAPGETKSNFEIFRLLAARMGFTESCFQDTEDDVIRATLDSGSPNLQGITLERLEREHFVRLNLPDPFLPFANRENEPTGDSGDNSDGGHGSLSQAPQGARGKSTVSPHPQNVTYTPPVESRLGAITHEFPLELVSSKNDDGLNSTFGFRDDVDRQTARLWIHPNDAAPRGIQTGDAVSVFNQRGSVPLQALVTDDVIPGIVRAPSVRWNKRFPGGRGINTLTSDMLTDAGGGPTFYNCLVQVQKCVD